MYQGEYNSKGGYHTPDLDAVLERAFAAGAAPTALLNRRACEGGAPLNKHKRYAWLPRGVTDVSVLLQSLGGAAPHPPLTAAAHVQV